MSKIRLVAFDIFGTIADGNSHPGPYARIEQELGVDGRQLSNMAQTRNLGVGALIDQLAPLQPAEQRQATEKRVLADLEADVARIFLFPETVAVFSALKARGVQTALVSNLAPPYALPIKSLLQGHGLLPEVCIWSFEVGAKKPGVEIYRRLFEKSHCAPQEILFIGDKADRDLHPPRELGCSSRLIARPGDRHYAKAIAGIPAEDRIEDLRDIFSVLNLTPGLDRGSLGCEASLGTNTGKPVDRSIPRY